MTQVTFGNGGWVAVGDLGLPGPVYIRFREIDGRMRMTEFYLDASESPVAIEPDDLHKFPLVPVENLVNQDAVQLTAFEGKPAPELSVLASHFTTSFAEVAPQLAEGNWVVASFAAQQLPRGQDRGWPPGSELPVMRVSRASRADWIVRTADTAFRLTAGPTRAGLTDEFLSEVTRAYNAAVARGERPNKSIFEQLGGGYPLKTVQRWVYTARQRGIMTRGRKGVSG